MMLVRLIDYLKRRLKTVVRVCYVILGLLVVADALPFLVDKEHAHTGAERWPGFWSLFGFVACTLIVLLSKWYGKAGIMQREDYYDE
jgi:hypothetical protein